MCALSHGYQGHKILLYDLNIDDHDNSTSCTHDHKTRYIRTRIYQHVHVTTLNLIFVILNYRPTRLPQSANNKTKV